MTKVRQHLGLNAGHIIAMSEGIYSDYGYLGVFQCLKGVTHEQMLEYEKQLLSDTSESNYNDPNKFVALLIKEGVLTPMEYQEIHLGQFGELRLS